LAARDKDRGEKYRFNITNTLRLLSLRVRLREVLMQFGVDRINTLLSQAPTDIDTTRDALITQLGTYVDQLIDEEKYQDVAAWRQVLARKSADAHETGMLHVYNINPFNLCLYILTLHTR